MDSNHRPFPCHGNALANCAKGPNTILSTNWSDRTRTCIGMLSRTLSGCCLAFQRTLQTKSGYRDSNSNPRVHSPVMLPLQHRPEMNRTGWGRTSDLSIISRTLIPTELQSGKGWHNGLEPSTLWSTTRCSNQLS